ASRSSIFSSSRHPRRPVAPPAFFLKKESAPAGNHISSSAQFKNYCHDEQRGIQRNAACTNAGGAAGFGSRRPARSFTTNLQSRAGIAGLEASSRGGCVRTV